MDRPGVSYRMEVDEFGREKPMRAMSPPIRSPEAVPLKRPPANAAAASKTKNHGASLSALRNGTHVV